MVLLVHPPLRHLFSRGQPAYYFQEQGAFPPLGLLSVAAYLRKHTELPVEVVDLRVAGLDDRQFQSWVRRVRPAVVGITCLTHYLFDALRTARLVKQAYPSAAVVLGGHHTSLYPMETLEQPEVDAIVLGAGERAFAELVGEVARTGRLSRRPGVLRPGDEATDPSLEIQSVADLDELPFPDRRLVPVEGYQYAVARRRVCSVMMTSIGCRYRCTFCDARGGQTRYRSAAKVVEEMAECARLGIEEILIQDENFASDRARVLAIADDLASRALPLVWSFETRVDHIDREIARAVRRAGCYSIHFGVESGSAEILARIRKGITLDQIRSVFSMLREEKIVTTASFIIGLPGERRSHVRRTVELAKQLRPAYVQFAMAIPLPGTPMYEEALERGLLEGDPWREFARHPTADFEPPGWYENFTRGELEQLLHQAYRSFYLRPGYVLRRLGELSSFRSLLQHARIGARIVRRR